MLTGNGMGRTWPKFAEMFAVAAGVLDFRDVRLSKPTRRNLLTCLTVLRKVFDKRSMVVDAFVVLRGLDGWVCASVRFTELLRAPQASLIIDHVRAFS